MRRFVLSAIAALLVGCAGGPFASYEFAPGTPRQQVLERMGQPSRVVKLANGGERLQYTMQPVGRFAWMVDLDASGRVVQARQVLTEANFHRIEPGKWTRDDVEREFGRPAWVDGVASWNGPIMTYRWRDIQRSDMFYYVYLDPQNVVRR
ncbi:MAG TPA: hypothetical protein VK996_16935, partial [Ramlibacter sp.]|nr:hypothetical protein [Ramlibacter sp.]